MKHYIALIFSIIVLGACTRVETDVSSFSTISLQETNSKFFVLPTEEQLISAEFAVYAESISKRISATGWQKVNNINEADYIVMFSFGMGGSETISGSSPIYGQTGGGYTSTYGTYSGSGSYGSYSGSSYTTPSYGVVGSTNYSITHNQRVFNLVVFNKDQKPVYEVNADSRGTSSTFGTVAECIFDSALKDFPYQSNKSKDSVTLDNCGQE